MRRVTTVMCLTVVLALGACGEVGGSADGRGTSSGAGLVCGDASFGKGELATMPSLDTLPDEVLALVTNDLVSIGDRPYRRRADKERITTLVDLRNDEIVATVRNLPSGPAVISAGSGRYRLSKQGALPIAWEVTEDLGGPQVLEILKLGSLVRIRTGTGVDSVTDAEFELLVVLSGMRLIGTLAPPAMAA